MGYAQPIGARERSATESRSRETLAIVAFVAQGSIAQAIPPPAIADVANPVRAKPIARAGLFVSMRDSASSAKTMARHAATSRTRTRVSVAVRTRSAARTNTADTAVAANLSASRVRPTPTAAMDLSAMDRQVHARHAALPVMNAKSRTAVTHPPFASARAGSAPAASQSPRSATGSTIIATAGSMRD